MGGKRSPDRVLLRWYLLGVLFVVIAAVALCGFLKVHEVTNGSGFASPQPLFAVEPHGSRTDSIILTFFGKRYVLQPPQTPQFRFSVYPTLGYCAGAGKPPRAYPRTKLTLALTVS